MFSATRSTILSFTASRSVADTDDRTAFSAHSALRPRSVAMVRAKAAASFSIFLTISLSGVPPPTVTGCAAPMFVAGAIAATCAAMVMNTPADAARAPVGADVDDDGHLGVQDGLDDGAHRALEAAGRIELEDEGLRPLALGALHRGGDEPHRHRRDRALHLDHRHRRGRGRRTRARTEAP